MDPFRPASPPEARTLAASTCNPAPNCSGFRPREAFLSPLWRLVSDHLDGFLRRYDERYGHTHGPLGSNVEKVWNDFLRCGDFNLGVLLLKCPECGHCLAVPTSCKTRICPSCMSRRSEDLALTLGDALPRVPYRHVVVTLPRLMGIRHRIREAPTLMRRIIRLATGVLKRELRSQARGHRNRRQEFAQALPGAVVAWSSSGDRLNFQPHLHILVTDGVFLPSGEFYGYLDWDSERLTALVRDSVLASFTRLGLLSREAAATMQAWPVDRSGFHVHVETRVDPDDRDRLRTLLKYLTRCPVALERIHYVEQSGEVTLTTKKGATLNYRHALDLLADLSQHIPPRGCRTLSRHGWFACALGQFEERGRPMGERPATPPPARPRRTPWAILIQWAWKVEPERCPCGAMMRRSRAILERHELVRLLTALHLAGYPRRPPAAPIPEGPPVTYGAVGARRSTPPPRPGLQVPSPPLEPPQNEHNQVPPGWEDWLD